MSSFSRKQWLMVLLCLGTLGFSIGLFIMNVTSMLALTIFFIFVAEVVLLVKMTKAPNSQRVTPRNTVNTPRYAQQPRNPVRAPVQTQSATRTAPAVKKQNAFWQWVQKTSKNVSAWMMRKSVGVAKSTGGQVRRGGGVVAGKAKQYPLLAFGIGFAFFTAALFWFAYTDKDWSLFHYGLTALGITIASFLIHAEKLGTTCKYLKNHGDATWLITSVLSAFLIWEHDWGTIPLIISIFSAVVAIVVIAGWQKGINDAIGELASTCFKKFLKLVSGGYGAWAAFLFFAIISFIAFFCFHQAGTIFGFDDEGGTFTLGLIFVIFFLLFLVTGIWKRHKTM